MLIYRTVTLDKLLKPRIHVLFNKGEKVLDKEHHDVCLVVHFLQCSMLSMWYFVLIQKWNVFCGTYSAVYVPEVHILQCSLHIGRLLCTRTEKMASTEND